MPRVQFQSPRQAEYDLSAAAIARLEEQQRVALLFFPAMVQSKQGGD